MSVYYFNQIYVLIHLPNIAFFFYILHSIQTFCDAVVYTVVIIIFCQPKKSPDSSVSCKESANNFLGQDEVRERANRVMMDISLSVMSSKVIQRG